MKFKIRPAERRDCPEILDLVRELALYEKAPEEVTVTLEHFTESGFGEHPVWWGFVAEVAEKVVGVALYYIRFSTWKGQRMYLEDIVVTESMRGKGMGKQLFDRCVQEAKDRNLKGMCWQVLDWNEPAIKFYKKYQAELDPEWINGSLIW